MERNKLVSQKIKVECSEDTITLKTVESLEQRRIRINSSLKKKRKVPEIEVILFDEDEIIEFQSIAAKIYARKRKERMLADKQRATSLLKRNRNGKISILQQIVRVLKFR